MDEKQQIRLIIREALFQNIDFGGGAPSDVAEAPPEQSSKKDDLSSKNQVLSLNPNDSVRQSRFKNVKNKVLKYNKAFYTRKKQPKEMYDGFNSEFEKLNKNFNSIAKEIRDKSKDSQEMKREYVAFFKGASEKVLKFLKNNAPGALMDQDVLAWYKTV